MAITGNKGEWSETYAFLRLLGAGKLYAADKNMNRNKDMFFPIIKILREERDYFTDVSRNVVNVFYKGNPVFSMPASNFESEADKLFSAINNQGAGTGSFGIPDSEAFFQKIFVTKLKAPSNDKSDLIIKIHDIQTGYEDEVGFSIKSNLGAPPTLLNPGKTTNFVFEVTGLSLSDIPAINEIETRTKIIDRMAAIKNKGGVLTFYKTDSPTFEENLTMIDSQMPVIVAEMLKGFYCEHIKECSRLAEYTADSNPLHHRKEFYIHKIKDLLCAVALGMKPATEWDGNDEANGGYIIVKSDGDVVAYHIYNRNFFKNYLLLDTGFDQPSTTRYEYCSLYEDKGRIFIKLNLQIRFL